MWIQLQEARSKFSVETEPENAVLIDPSEGYLSSGGTASIHFKRSDASPSMGRINCKVCLYFLFCSPVWQQKTKVRAYVLHSEDAFSKEIPCRHVCDGQLTTFLIVVFKEKNSMLSLQFPVSYSPRNNQFGSFFRFTIARKMRSAYTNHFSLRYPSKKKLQTQPHQKSHLRILWSPNLHQASCSYQLPGDGIPM